MPKRGFFLAIEGTDGVGKSTQTKRIAAALTKLGVDVVVTREPGGTQLGEEVRKLLKSKGEIGLRAEALLMLGSRAQLCEELIVPALEKGQFVISDRFTGSFYAYQGYGRGLDLTELKQMTDFAISGLVPDLTILLENPNLRSHQPLDQADRFESLGKPFLDRVFAGYYALAQEYGWKIVSSDSDLETITDLLLNVIVEDGRVNLGDLRVT